jgi:hypothetical protein
VAGCSLACIASAPQRHRGLSLLFSTPWSAARTAGHPVSSWALCPQRAKRPARRGRCAVQAGSAGRATPMPSCAHAPHHAQARSEFRLCARGRSWECVRAPQRSPPPVSRHRTAEPAFTPVCCGFISQHLQLKRAVAAQVAPARPRIASTESAAPTAHGQRGWTAKKRPLGRTALRGVHCSPVRQPS